MKSETLRTMIGLVGALAVFAGVMALQLPIYLAVILPLVTYGALHAVLIPQPMIGHLKYRQLRTQELKALLKEGWDQIQQLEQARQEITNPQIRGLVDDLYDSAVKLFEHLNENPEKIGLARMFISYYLNKAVKFVENYNTIADSDIDTPTIQQSKYDIVKGLQLLSQEFDHQFEELLAGELMDIKTDVALLEENQKRKELGL